MAQAPAGEDRIDSQSHLFAPEMVRLMELRKSPPYIYQEQGSRYLVVGRWHRLMVSHAADLEQKLTDMGEAGIGTAILSTNDPGPEQFGDDGPRVARIIHDHLYQVSQDHPGRFFPLASLPLLQMDAALAELDRCVGELGMKGVLLYSNLAGKFPDEAEFAPLFARVVELDLPVVLHPASPVTHEATSGYNLTGGLGLMFDTTIALCRLILSGIFDRHPELKLVCPHVGGTLPYLIGRVDHQVGVLKRMDLRLARKPSDYLRENVYFDTVNVLPEVIRFGYEMVGPDRMLFATDHPWVETERGVNNLKSLGLPAEDEQKIFAGNARRLFKL